MAKKKTLQTEPLNLPGSIILFFVIYTLTAIKDKIGGSKEIDG